MSNFDSALGEFIWERIDPVLLKDEEHKTLLSKIKCDCEEERRAIVDYGSAIAELVYKTGLSDGIKLAAGLEVRVNG